MVFRVHVLLLIKRHSFYAHLLLFYFRLKSSNSSVIENVSEPVFCRFIVSEYPFFTFEKKTRKATLRFWLNWLYSLHFFRAIKRGASSCEWIPQQLLRHCLEPPSNSSRLPPARSAQTNWEEGSQYKVLLQGKDAVGFQALHERPRFYQQGFFA